MVANTSPNMTSIDFFGMDQSTEASKYVSTAKENVDIVTLRGGLRKIGKDMILYDRCPTEKTRAMAESGRSEIQDGKLFETIKLLKRVTDEGASFFFVAFNQYEDKLKEVSDVLTYEYAARLADNLEEWRVKQFAVVRMGEVFSVKKNNHFMRVRIVKIDPVKKVFTYWALDEAFFDTCDETNLYLINSKIIEMPILAVPAVFEIDPKPSQLRKFEDKKYCVSWILQPLIKHDSAPRKITFFNF